MTVTSFVDLLVRSANGIGLSKLTNAVYLAGATAALTPPVVETYELHPVDPGLPRVVYVDQLHQQGLMAQTFLYGKHTQGLEPTLLHPNEMLDGVLVNGNYRAPRPITTPRKFTS